MKYLHILDGVFLERKNRFVAEIELNGKRELCHVKNTGRCRELFVPGTPILVEKSEKPDRKTGYDLIAVRKDNRLVNVDSQIPNGLAEEWLKSGGLLPDLTVVKREVKYHHSRFDLYLEWGNGKRGFMEVKGVTLEENGIARFPDAPTERGVRHVEELCRCKEEGYEAFLLFVIQMKGIHVLEPNWATHPQFGEALRRARQAGVCLLARDCLVERDEIRLDQDIPVRIS